MGDAILAPGTNNTSNELRDSNLRPSLPRDSLPTFPDDIVEIDLDFDIFTESLRSSRKGSSAGISGLRNEHLKICLDDESLLRKLFWSCSISSSRQGSIIDFIISEIIMYYSTDQG